MALLAEYGLIPDVFDPTCYTSADLADVHLQHLKEVLLSEGLVRDFRDGDWLRQFDGGSRPWHKRGQELLKKLVTQNRLRVDCARLASAPATDVEWCNEAIASHGAFSIDGIVTTESTSGQFRGERLVAPITKLSSAGWWTSRSPSVRLSRTLVDYQQHLALVLACANSIMLIDAHLDPSLARYSDIVPLVCGAAGRTPKPLIELHRVCYVGSGPQRQIVTHAEWERRFNEAMSAQLRAAQLTVEVLIWDDFHDRHIISDLIGIGMQNGLDTTRAVNTATTWHRMGRTDRDDVQREFDPASRRHSLQHRFSLP